MDKYQEDKKALEKRINTPQNISKKSLKD